MPYGSCGTVSTSLTDSVNLPGETIQYNNSRDRNYPPYSSDDRENPDFVKEISRGVVRIGNDTVHLNAAAAYEMLSQYEGIALAGATKLLTINLATKMITIESSQLPSIIAQLKEIAGSYGL